MNSTHKKIKRMNVVVQVDNIDVIVTVGAHLKCTKMQLTVVFRLMYFESPMTKCLSINESLQLFGVPKLDP